MIKVEGLRQAVTAFNDAIWHYRVGEAVQTAIFPGDRPLVAAAFRQAGLAGTVPSGCLDKEHTGPLFSEEAKARFALAQALGPHIRIENYSNGKSHWLAWTDPLVEAGSPTKTGVAAEGPTPEAATAALIDRILFDKLGGAENLTQYPVIPGSQGAPKNAL